jgi:hypothetical protein
MNDDDDDKPAAWWRESLTLARVRHSAPLALAGGAALLTVGCADFNDEERPDAPIAQRADEIDHSVKALALQRTEGWDVGGVDTGLRLTDPSPLDAFGTEGWSVEVAELYSRLRPTREALLPYYVPTLFQSLIDPAAERLLAQMRPIHTRLMEDDFARGMALRELFEQAGWPSDTAVVVDAPGPRSVAVAAALADRFDPVFTFGNWPHPVGVVPAQDTLGASLFYLPVFEQARPMRQNDAPPVFVLDSNRLLPYRDADLQFDNRYLVQLPSAAQLAALGIRHLLYVNADGQGESDDLNQALVALCAAGIDVRTAALADFQRGQPLVEAQAEPVPAGDDDDDRLDALSFVTGCFWYGGVPEWHAQFWEDYGWYRGGHNVWVGPPHHRHGVTVGPPRVSRPHMTHAFAIRPSLRGTMFDDFGLRAVAPRGFGEVAVRTSRYDGTVTAVRVGGYQPHGAARGSSYGYAGGSSRGSGFSHWGMGGGGRSGSFGRAGGGMSG